MVLAPFRAGLPAVLLPSVLSAPSRPGAERSQLVTPRSLKVLLLSSDGHGHDQLTQPNEISEVQHLTGGMTVPTRPRETLVGGSPKRERRSVGSALG